MKKPRYYRKTQTDDLFEHLSQKFLGLDRELKIIRGSLKVKVAKTVQIEKHMEKEKNKLQQDTGYTDEQGKKMKNRIKKFNDKFLVQKESINILKG